MAHEGNAIELDAKCTDLEAKCIALIADNRRLRAELRRSMHDRAEFKDMRGKLARLDEVMARQEVDVRKLRGGLHALLSLFTGKEYLTAKQQELLFAARALVSRFTAAPESSRSSEPTEPPP